MECVFFLTHGSVKKHFLLDTGMGDAESGRTLYNNYTVLNKSLTMSSISDVSNQPRNKCLRSVRKCDENSLIVLLWHMDRGWKIKTYDVLPVLYDSYVKPIHSPRTVSLFITFFITCIPPRTGSSSRAPNCTWIVGIGNGHVKLLPHMTH